MFEIVNLAFTVLLAAASWFVLSLLAERRELKAKRRDVVSTHLIEAYQQLSRLAGCMRNEMAASPQIAEDINYAIMNIQLFGTHKQIEIAMQFARVAEDGQTICLESLGKLVYDLRDRIRRDLDIEPVGPFHQVLCINAHCKESPNKAMHATSA